MVNDVMEQESVALPSALSECLENDQQPCQKCHQRNEMLEMSIHGNCSVDANTPRARKIKRPFSPEQPPLNDKKTSNRAKVRKRVDNLKTSHQNNTFTCDKCGATSVVDPSRCRLPPGQMKKVQTMRKKFDPVTNKILHLCNACGLAFSRPPKKTKVVPVIEDRDTYLAESKAFAKSIAEQFGKPAAERLYCPSFKNRPCSCIQSYISHSGDDEGTPLENRVDNLLQFFNTACDLNRRKNLFPEYLMPNERNTDDTNTNAVERKQRQRDYEHFVLETRQLLRENLHLCERACQQILLYSNNFLHKRLKSAPDQSSRLSRKCGNSTSSQLKSIEELSSISCCTESCSRIALTHSALLEEWRKQAAQGQRQARRVLAEMLTPSGGTKANCYKFISMVTGCGPTTISSVSHQMRITKGNREPPEHGLKKWFRENPRKQSKSGAPQVFNQDSSSKQDEAAMEILEEDPKILLEQQRQELEEAKRQLFLKQQELDRCQQIIDQHLGQQVLSADNPNNNPMWKVNESELLTLPVDSDEAIMSGLTNGQSVQLIDLVPGTYIAVPSSFDSSSSSFLTMASDPKQTIPISNSLNANQVHAAQEIIYSNNSHPNQDKTNNSTLIHPESRTIFTISSGPDMVNTIIEEVEPLDNGYSEMLVTAPTDVCEGVEFSYPTEHDHNKQCNISSISSSCDKCDPDNNSTLLPIEGTDQSTLAHIPSSCPTSVIMPPNNMHAGRSVPNEPQAECSSIMKCVKNVSEFDLSPLNNVILVPSTEQSKSSSICMNAFDGLFE